MRIMEHGFFHTLNNCLDVHIDLPLMCEVWKVDFSTLWTMDFPWSMFIHSISVAQRMSISHCWTGSSRRFLSQWVSLQHMVTIHGQNTFILLTVSLKVNKNSAICTKPFKLPNIYFFISFSFK